MPNATQPVLEITDVEKRYQALRPFRLQALTIAPGERVAVVGLDAGAAEVLGRGRRGSRDGARPGPEQR